MFLKLLPIWLTYFLAAATPGAAQIYIIENAFLGSAKRGRWAALGVSLGSATWALVVTFGLSRIGGPHGSGQLLLKIGSALLLYYFICVNIQKFFLAKHQFESKKRTLRDEDSWRTFTKGFLANLFNPNSVVFFLSLFAPLILTTRSTKDLCICIVGVTIISLFWYQILVLLASHRYSQQLLLRFEAGTRLLFIIAYFGFLLKILRTI